MDARYDRTWYNGEFTLRPTQTPIKMACKELCGSIHSAQRQTDYEHRFPLGSAPILPALVSLCIRVTVSVMVSSHCSRLRSILINYDYEHRFPLGSAPILPALVSLCIRVTVSVMVSSHCSRLRSILINVYRTNGNLHRSRSRFKLKASEHYHETQFHWYGNQSQLV